MDAEGDLRVVWNAGLDVPAFTRHVPAADAMHPVQRLTSRSTYLRLSMRGGGAGLLVWGRSAWDLRSSARAVRFRADGSVADQVHRTPYASHRGLVPLSRGRFLNVQIDPRNDSDSHIQARVGP